MRPATNQQQLIPISEAARVIGCTYRHCRRLIDRGELAAQIVSRSARGAEWRVHRADAETFELPSASWKRRRA